MNKKLTIKKKTVFKMKNRIFLVSESDKITFTQTLII